MLQKVLKYLIASVWLVNGLICKVLNFTQRHQEIVGAILNIKYAREITLLIGVLEVIMSFWILSNYKQKLSAFTQIFFLMTMNSIEFIYVKELLLWGELNLVFAIIFSVIVYYSQFLINKK